MPLQQQQQLHVCHNNNNNNNNFRAVKYDQTANWYSVCFLSKSLGDVIWLHMFNHQCFCYDFCLQRLIITFKTCLVWRTCKSLNFSVIRHRRRLSLVLEIANLECYKVSLPASYYGFQSDAFLILLFENWKFASKQCRKGK